jgi:hypothetical protein
VRAVAPGVALAQAFGAAAGEGLGQRRFPLFVALHYLVDFERKLVALLVLPLELFFQSILELDRPLPRDELAVDGQDVVLRLKFFGNVRAGDHRQQLVEPRSVGLGALVAGRLVEPAQVGQQQARIDPPVVSTSSP